MEQFTAVLNTLACIRLEQYKSGVVFEPIVGKQAFVMKTMGISLPNSMMSLTKEYEYVVCSEDSLNAEDGENNDEYKFDQKVVFTQAIRRIHPL